MKFNIKSPNATIKVTLINRLTGKSHRVIRLFHSYHGEHFITGDKVRPILLCSVQVYNLIKNA